MDCTSKQIKACTFSLFKNTRNVSSVETISALILSYNTSQWLAKAYKIEEDAMQCALLSLLFVPTNTNPGNYRKKQKAKEI